MNLNGKISVPKLHEYRVTGPGVDVVVKATSPIGAMDVAVGETRCWERGVFKRDLRVEKVV